MTATLALSGVGTGAAPLAQAAASSPVSLIIDTDMFTNADDVGAIAVANALQDNGKVNLLGVMVDKPSRWGAPAVSAINTYYHHGNIPVGTHKPVDDSVSSPNYAQDLAQNYPNSIHDGANAPEAVGLYRKILSAQPDHSVVIAAIGIETTLADVLNSAPDQNSPLTGAQLVANKVRLLSMMGGIYPSGLEYNFAVNPSAAVKVVNNWPTAAVFSGYEVGVNVLAGAKLSQTPATNPVRGAYEVWGGSGIDISSFDAVATLYACLGTDGLFSLSAAGSNRVAANGSNQWQSSPVKDQHYLINVAPVSTIADVLQPLMSQAPSGTATGAIAAYYQQLGGSGSYLGNLVGGEYGTAGGGKAQAYTGGSIYWSQASGAHAVHGAIVGRYNALGGPGGMLGYPTTDEMGTPDGVGRFNHFSGDGGSSIYWTPSTGAWSIRGGIRGRWASMGWERSALGYPTTDESGTPDGVGRFNHFSGDGGSSIYWTPSTGAWSIRGAIRASWASMGWEHGRLGYPVTDEYGIPSGRRNDFVHGRISYFFAGNQIQVG